MKKICIKLYWRITMIDISKAAFEIPEKAKEWFMNFPEVFYLANTLTLVIKNSLITSDCRWHDNKERPRFMVGRGQASRLRIYCSENGALVVGKLAQEDFHRVSNAIIDKSKIKTDEDKHFVNIKFSTKESNTEKLTRLRETLGTGVFSELKDSFYETLIDLDCSVSLSPTERESLIQSRIGQGKYRKSLISLWKGCAVTGVKFEAVLKASHIRPWKDSDNLQRLDKYNGLLLSSLYDDLFDKGFISFEDSGEIIFSKKLPLNLIDELQLDNSIKIKTQSEHHKYLKYHLSVILKV